MNRPIRFAHIGLDHPHAAGFLESLLLISEIELAALYEPDLPSVGRTFQPELRDVPVYDDLSLMLARERPEAVLITLPNESTPAAIIAAAEIGAHIYAEKPCARTAAEFRPAAEAVRNAGVQFATGYLRRWSPQGRAIKEFCDQGLLGTPVSVEARWVTTSVGRRDPTHFLFSREHSGGGVLHWLGCHWLDFMLWVTGEQVMAVSAMAATLGGEAISVEDTAALVMRFSNQMIGSLHCSYVTDEAIDQRFFGLRGTSGWVSWERLGPEIVLHSAHPAWAGASTRITRFESDDVAGYGGADGIALLRQFIASFRESGPPAFVVDDALHVLEVLDGVRESVFTGREAVI